MARSKSDPEDEHVKFESKNRLQERLLWLAVVVLVGAVAFTLGTKRGRSVSNKQSLQSPKSGQSDTVSIHRTSNQQLADLTTTETLKANPGGVLHMKWASPVYTVNLKSVVKDIDDFNSELKALILSHYKTFELAANGTMEYKGSGQGVNQMFFEWQRDGGWVKHLESTPVMQRLLRIINIGRDTYFESIDTSANLMAKEAFAADDSFHAWATVMEQGNYHTLHNHPGHLLSGCYYINTPPDSGAISFYDPRGVHHPFNDQMLIYPKAGDLILFPPWLSHEVLATPGNHQNPRVSIAFNWGLPTLDNQMLTTRASREEQATFGGPKQH